MNSERKTVRLDPVLITEMQEVIRQSGYSHQSDFIRAAIRTQIDKEKLKHRADPHPHAGGGSR